MDLQNNNGQATGLSLLGGRGLHDYSVDIDNLEVRMDTAETNITSNDGELSNLEVRMDTAETNITSNDGELTDHESRIGSLEDVAGVGNHEDSHLVHIEGTQTIIGSKTFESNVIVEGEVQCDDVVLEGTFTGNLQAALYNLDTLKADDVEVVHKTGNETVDGEKTFRQTVYVGELGQTWASGERSDVSTIHGNV